MFVNSLNNVYRYYNIYNNYNRVFNFKINNKNNVYSNINKVYNALYKQNEKYQQNMKALAKYQKESQEFYSDFDDKFSELKTSSNRLKAYSINSAFDPKGYASTDRDVISVTDSKMYDGNEYFIDVEKIAKSQITSTENLKSDSKNLSGKSSITLKSDFKTYNFEFEFSNDTTNGEAIQQIADRINSSNVNVKANLVQKDGKSNIEFVSKNTGEKNAFDISFGGKLQNVSVNTVQNAQSAQYSINDVKLKSESNNITFGNGAITAVLKSEGNSNLVKDAKNDKDIIESIKDFTDDYNEVLSFLNRNSDKSDAIDNLAYSYGMTRFSRNSLSQIGIDVDNKGNLTIDEKRLESALSENPSKVKELIASSSGLASTAYAKTNKAMISSKDLYTPPELNNYRQYNGYTYQNRLINSNMYLNGMFLNYMI